MTIFCSTEAYLTPLLSVAGVGGTTRVHVEKYGGSYRVRAASYHMAGAALDTSPIGFHSPLASGAAAARISAQTARAAICRTGAARMSCAGAAGSRRS